jgi:hypothetical protein
MRQQRMPLFTYARLIDTAKIMLEAAGVVAHVLMFIFVAANAAVLVLILMSILAAVAVLAVKRSK